MRATGPRTKVGAAAYTLFWMVLGFTAGMVVASIPVGLWEAAHPGADLTLANDVMLIASVAGMSLAARIGRKRLERHAARRS